MRKLITRPATGLFLGPLLFVLLLLLPLPVDMPTPALRVAAVASLMAMWWITEATPIAATALLPIVLFPLLGVMSTAETTLSYANHLIYLFMGGFLIAITMQKWQLHKRIAMHTIQLVGVTPNRMILGFMAATAFLSMWISNTATTMMMLPIGLAVTSQLNTMHGQQLERTETSDQGKHFGLALMLGIAYSASIGGVATLIGTPPNAILAGMAEKLFGLTIGFADWLIFGLPLSLIMLAGAPLVILIGTVTLTVIFLTEVTSNTATATLMIPVMGALAIAMEVHPYVLMIPAAIAASWAFMLPVATPPNAIVFSSKYITIPQMAKAGFWLNIVAAILISLFVLFGLPLAWELDLVNAP